MIVVGIDPGSEHSGIVFFNVEENRVIEAEDVTNSVALAWCRGVSRARIPASNVQCLFVETIESMGLAVGKSTFQTCIWIGRFIQAFETTTGSAARLVSRGDEKTVLCGASTFRNPDTGKRKAVGDGQIRKAIIERFPATGGGAIPQIGTKAQPGPLYGVSGHCWQALAVVLTGLEGLK